MQYYWRKSEFMSHEFAPSRALMLVSAVQALKRAFVRVLLFLAMKYTVTLGKGECEQKGRSRWLIHSTRSPTHLEWKTFLEPFGSTGPLQ